MNYFALSSGKNEHPLYDRKERAITIVLFILLFSEYFVQLNHITQIHTYGHTNELFS